MENTYEKYIAFTVTDVVLLHIMWYIRASLITQEREMEDKNLDAAFAVFKHATTVANKYGPIIIDESNNRGSVAVTSASLMLVAVARAMDMSIHDCVSLVMQMYKKIEKQERENDEADE
jgi:hypothetical protein